MLEKEKKIKKKTLGNYPFLSVIFSVSLSLFLIGIFSILLISSYKMKINIQKNIELNIYLNKVVSINDIERINKIILSKNYVLNKDEGCKTVGTGVRSFNAIFFIGALKVLKVGRGF